MKARAADAGARCAQGAAPARGGVRDDSVGRRGRGATSTRLHGDSRRRRRHAGEDDAVRADRDRADHGRARFGQVLQRHVEAVEIGEDEVQAFGALEGRVGVA